MRDGIDLGHSLFVCLLGLSSDIITKCRVPNPLGVRYVNPERDPNFLQRQFRWMGDSVTTDILAHAPITNEEKQNE